MQPLVSRSVLLVLTALAVAMTASGQLSTGAITGIVSDPTGAVVPGAAVEATGLETGASFTAEASASGEYTIPLLQPGSYRLTVRSPGFRTYSRSNVTIESGRTIRIDMALEVGEVTETVEVSAATPLLESETSTVGQFIENKSVTDMPLSGRRVGDLLGLMGHSVYVAGNTIRPRVSVAGGRADQQTWQIDGVNANNVGLEIPQALFNPPVESTQELRIQQNNYSAEYGNSSGGVVAITTKSGTNEFHGNAYYNLRNEKLDARNFFAAERTPLKWNMFGGSAGGPILKNRTFFFVNPEWNRQRNGIVRRFTVPTALERSGDFSQTTNNAGALTTIHDWNTQRPDPDNPSRIIRDPFPGNVIPQNMMDPVGSQLTSFYPNPNNTPTNLAGANNFLGSQSNGLNLFTLTLKVDHTFDENNRFTFRHILHDFPTANQPVFSQTAADPFANVTDRRAFSYLFNFIHNFTPTMINDLRVNWQPRRFEISAIERDGNWPQQLGLQGVSGMAFPRINAAGFQAMGLTNQFRDQRPIQDLHIVENVSKFHANHSWKFGFEFRRSRNKEDLRRLESGQFNFNPQPTGLPGTGNTGHAIASMLVGFPNRGQTFLADTLDRRADYYAVYANDDWKARSNLTLNLGVRWEAHTPKTDALDRMNGFDLNAINPVSGTPGVITFAGRDGVGRTVYDGDYNNVGPRVGLAWKPTSDQKLVIRAGYGVFYGVPLPGSNNMAAGFSDQGDFTTPDNGITPPFLLRDGVPSAEREELGPGFGAVPVGEGARFSPQFIDQDRELGYSQMWNLSIQREIGWRTMLEVSYAGNVGHKLPALDISINQVRPELMGPGNAQARRPFPQFNNVVTVRRMWGNSSYHGLNIKLEKRFSDGLNFLANYTWAKFIDDVPAQFEAGQTRDSTQNLYDRAAEKALSGNDVRHRFVWSSVYELPWGSGRKYLNQGPLGKIAGGWNLGLIVTLQAGSPISLVTQVNGTNAFTPGPQRVDVLRDPALPESQRTVDRYFDTEAVAAPAQFTFGNAGRSILTGPGLTNFDISLLKNHPIGERFNVQFRAEAFNAFNHVNFNEPGRAFGASNFGVVNSARAGRIMQLGLKLSF